MNLKKGKLTFVTLFNPRQCVPIINGTLTDVQPGTIPLTLILVVRISPDIDTGMLPHESY